MELHRFTPVHPDAMVSEPDGTHVLYSQVEPLEALTTAQAGIIRQSGEEVAKLRVLVQVLGNAFALADTGHLEADGTKHASGHSHFKHAVWDMDNRKELAGKPCMKCLAFDAARNALKEAGFTPTNTEDK